MLRCNETVSNRTRNNAIVIPDVKHQILLLSYFGGLFDGDGCVKVGRVKQNDKWNYYAELELFSEFEHMIDLLIQNFEGKKYCRRRKDGTIKGFEWRVIGHPAVNTAILLSRFCLIKSPQLYLVSTFPLGSPHRGGSSKEQIAFAASMRPAREIIYEQLKVMKKTNSSVDRYLSVVEFHAIVAGFFDADGHISTKDAVIFSQKHINMLLKIQEYFCGGTLTEDYAVLKGVRHGPYGRLSYSKRNAVEIVNSILPFVHIGYKRDGLARLLTKFQ